MIGTGPTPETRRLIENRSRGKCERCGVAAPLGAFTGQDHHRSPRKSGGSKNVSWMNLPSNLVRLCYMCHSLIESRRQLARDTGWLVRRSLADRMGGSAWMPIFDTNRGVWILTDLGEKRRYNPDVDWVDEIATNQGERS